ncbi:uncharacterized protein LOC143543823 [Bidens hawaiensis]|uniref:uncharacterized protein LOC143543823 n=1 Tax=Bidens hawaiensis TaxID=980011 RepID=UPI00404AEFBD
MVGYVGYGDLTSYEELEELRGLLKLCENVKLKAGEDMICWSLDTTGSFTVKGLKRCILENSLSDPGEVFKWNRLVPKKVNFVSWRASLSRLPTFDALKKRNIPVLSDSCPICGEIEESVEHVFVSCGLAQIMWSIIAQWCNLPSLLILSFRDVMDLHNFSSLPMEKAKILHAICLTAIWCLWKKRNELVHSGIPIKLSTLLEEIKVLGYLWIKNRAKKYGLTWEDWCKFRV